MAHCRSCGAEILWVETIKHKWMPLDADSDPEGTIVIRDGLAIKLAEEERILAQEPLYTPHHMTCPQGNDWKRRP